MSVAVHNSDVELTEEHKEQCENALRKHYTKLWRAELNDDDRLRDMNSTELDELDAKVDRQIRFAFGLDGLYQ